MPATVEQLLARLAPTGTGVAACRGHEASLFERLTAEEQSLVDSARPSPPGGVRGRAVVCAPRARRRSAPMSDTIGRGARRQPVWPDGVTGSISHAGGARGGRGRTDHAIARRARDRCRARAARRGRCGPHVLTPAERACVSKHSDDPAAPRRRLQRQGGGVQGPLPAAGRGDRLPRRPHRRRRRQRDESRSRSRRVRRRSVTAGWDRSWSRWRSSRPSGDRSTAAARSGERVDDERGDRRAGREPGDDRRGGVQRFLDRHVHVEVAVRAEAPDEGHAADLLRPSAT